MAIFVLDGIGIKGISCAVPEKVFDNTEFYGKFGKEATDNVIKMTGVRFSHRAPEEQTASDLCYVAAKNLIEKKNISTEEIGALVFISQTPDYRLPATACVLHKRLGLSMNCMAFDVNLGCSGWVYGVNIVGSLMKTSGIEKTLLLFGDTSIRTVSPEDRGAVMLFGEGGSATLLVKDDSESIRGELMTDGEGFKTIIMPSGAYRNRNGSAERVLHSDEIVRSDYDGHMNGTDVFSFTITQVPKLIKRFAGEKGLDQYDALVLHQANLYILQQISRKTKVPMDKIPISLDRYGNTSGTSIPITLCDAYGNETGTKKHLLMSGFGIGLSWGVIEADIHSDDIFPIVVTDEFFDDGIIGND
ncbi:MAG: ketoacyl-ACP synthase III [Clostridiales bacterium]|jgi:3-oxoacyl-[acyl-carrier-protein] synthase-3|nr:ketoacyl-ACP synthase III [Clostridiales bacterium]